MSRLIVIYCRPVDIAGRPPVLQHAVVLAALGVEIRLDHRHLLLQAEALYYVLLAPLRQLEGRRPGTNLHAKGRGELLLARVEGWESLLQGFELRPHLATDWHSCVDRIDCLGPLGRGHEDLGGEV